MTGVADEAHTRELREHLCRILHDANTGRITPDATDPTKYGAMADAVLASDWLAERDLLVAAQALQDAADDMENCHQYGKARLAIAARLRSRMKEITE